MSVEYNKKLKDIFSKDLSEYAPIPFWSWNNELDETELLNQIEDLKEAGMGGFIMHARIGLSTEYLGEKWFSCIGACLKKAKELGMRAWIYDENGWPSGFIGGKLLENESYRAKYLEYKTQTFYDKSAYCVFIKKDEKFIRINDFVDSERTYYCVYLLTSPSNTDILNPVVVDQFINGTHEKYYQRFSQSFGKELAGFFTDEPQYYRNATPYTKELEGVFLDKYNQDVKDGLIYLFVSSKQGYSFRTNYFKELNNLYVTNYYKKIYDWCSAHNCKLTGHSVEETSLAGQMLGGASVMPTYEYEHIPAIDLLGGACAPEISIKQVGSVAAQLGKKQVLTETFGCSGYDITPLELCSIGEYQFFNGVSLLCHHLVPFSLAGQGKYDYPTIFSRQNNWWKQFRTFNEHFTRLGYIISNTREEYDVGVILPMRSVWLEHIWGETSQKVNQIQKSFDDLLFLFRKQGVRYQIIDESLLLKHGFIDGSELVVGTCGYKTIIVPEMLSIAKSTLELLQNHKGNLLVLKDIEHVDGEKANCVLSSNITIEQIINNRGLHFSCEDGLSFMTSRIGEFGEFIFIKNLSNTNKSLVSLVGAGNTYQELNLETCELSCIEDEMVLNANDSKILIKSSFAKSDKKDYFEENVTNNFRITDITENYFVMDTASFSKDGITFSENKNLQEIFEILLYEDYKGLLYIKQKFFLKDLLPIKFICEKNRYKFLKVNGNDIRLIKNDFDIYFKQADISKYVKLGENEIVYCIDYFQHDGVHFALFDPQATESLRNCLYYDTHIENTYLKGDFLVNADMTIEKKLKEPLISFDLYKKGYPFFKGVITLAGTYEYNGFEKRLLSLVDGRFLVAEISINGQEIDMVFDRVIDITKYLLKGSNNIIIKLRSSLRNLFGPHHSLASRDFEGLTDQFTFRGQWVKGKPLNFTNDYNFAPFGVETIKILRTNKDK